MARWSPRPAPYWAATIMGFWFKNHTKIESSGLTFGSIQIWNYFQKPALLSTPTRFRRKKPRTYNGGRHYLSAKVSFRPMLVATTQAAAVIAHEMKKAVHGSRPFGVATMAGTQTRSVNRLSIAA